MLEDLINQVMHELGKEFKIEAKKEQRERARKGDRTNPNAVNAVVNYYTSTRIEEIFEEETEKEQFHKLLSTFYNRQDIYNHISQNIILYNARNSHSKLRSYPVSHLDAISSFRPSKPKTNSLRFVATSSLHEELKQYFLNMWALTHQLEWAIQPRETYYGIDISEIEDEEIQRQIEVERKYRSFSDVTTRNPISYRNPAEVPAQQALINLQTSGIVELHHALAELQDQGLFPDAGFNYLSLYILDSIKKLRKFRSEIESEQKPHTLNFNISSSESFYYLMAFTKSENFFYSQWQNKIQPDNFKKYSNHPIEEWRQSFANSNSFERHKAVIKSVWNTKQASFYTKEFGTLVETAFQEIVNKSSLSRTICRPYFLKHEVKAFQTELKQFCLLEDKVKEYREIITYHQLEDINVKLRFYQKPIRELMKIIS